VPFPTVLFVLHLALLRLPGLLGGRRVQELTPRCVLVDETAQYVAASNVCGAQVTRRWRQVLDRRPKIESPMRSRLVVVRDVGAKDAVQVSAEVVEPDVGKPRDLEEPPPRGRQCVGVHHPAIAPVHHQVGVLPPSL
jgi:hypothetical protein